jgi:hypothetical protein
MMPYYPNGTYVESIEEYHVRLLRRAADCLQAYCENENGDMNDALAMEIYQALDKAERTQQKEIR